MSAIKKIGVCYLLALLAGCGGEKGVAPSDAEYHANLEKWHSHTIHDYQVNFRLSCYCMVETTAEKVLQVNDGAITDAYYLDSGESVPAGDIYQDLLTVEDAFELIQSLKIQLPSELQVTYDDTYGYPTSIHVDFLEGVADDEQSWYFSNLMDAATATLPGIGAASYPYKKAYGDCTNYDYDRSMRIYSTIEQETGLVAESSFTFTHSAAGVGFELPWGTGEITFDIRSAEPGALALASLQFARLGQCTTWEIWTDPYTAGYDDEREGTRYDDIATIEINGDDWTTVTFSTWGHYDGRYDDAIVLNIADGDEPFAIRNITFTNTETGAETPLTGFYY